MKELLTIAAIALVLSVFLAFLILPILRKLKFGQSILEIGPKWHKQKQGTPTMGGFIFMIGLTIAAFFGGFWLGHFDEIALAVAMGWAFGIIGFVDDYAKIRKKQNQGLTSVQKLCLQLAVAAAFLALLRVRGFLDSTVDIPVLNLTFALPWAVYVAVFILGVAGMANAVNFTDGLDGLCGGVTLPIAALIALFAAGTHPGVAGVAAALFGGLVGFLIFNIHPAKVFMGDTGSLFLGGILCAMVFLVNMPLMILVAGFVYLCEMVSVILQVGFFKLTGGKRLFKMAPLHHHFEMSGWKETPIVLMFTGVTVLMCVLAWTIFRTC